MKVFFTSLPVALLILINLHLVRSKLVLRSVCSVGVPLCLFGGIWIPLWTEGHFSNSISLPLALAANYDNTYDDWEPPEEKPWQEVWASRAAKASKMTSDEIFLAAKGAANRDASLGPETAKGMKRPCPVANRAAPAGVVM